MLYLYFGTDRMKVSSVVKDATQSFADKHAVIRICDVHTKDDLEAALAGGGMFGGARAVVLESLLENEELRELLMSRLENIKASADHIYVVEEKIDATTKKALSKYATTVEQCDLPKKEIKDNSIFELANALQAKDKRELWILYQRQLAAGSSPEAIHGVLFWKAKQMLLQGRTDAEKRRAEKLIKILAQAPHDARRHGVELEYALERLVLSQHVVS